MTFRVYGDGVVAKSRNRNSTWKSVVDIHHINEWLEIDRKIYNQRVELPLVRFIQEPLAKV